MIKLRITNYKAIRDASILIRGLTILRGESNQGKSSIIQALKAAMTNRFNGTCVRHGEEKAMIGLMFSDLPGSKFFVTRKAAGGSPIYRRDDKDADPLVLSKLNRDAPPKEFSGPFGVVKVPVADTQEHMNFMDQFSPPITLRLDAKKIIEVFSNSLLLQEYQKAHDAVTTRRPELKGATTSVEQVLYDTTNQLIKAQALRTKLPDKAKMIKLSADINVQSDYIKMWTRLASGRALFLIIQKKLALLNQIHEQFEAIRVIQKEGKLQKWELLKITLDTSLTLDKKIELKDMMESEFIDRQNLVFGIDLYTLLKSDIDKRNQVGRRLMICNQIQEIFDPLDKASKQLKIYSTLIERRSAYVILNKSITTLQNLTKEGICPVCGNELLNHGEHRTIT